MLVFVYGFNLWTLFLSFTNSKAFANLNFIGWANYQKLWNWTFETDPPSSWYTALVNMGMFGGLYVVFCLVLGLTLAILLDQKIRGEGILRPIYLYPLALSFIVTGTAWKLFLDPRIGLEKAMHDWGWTSFHFDWVVNPRMMIYCVAIAGVWQTSGFVMAMFLAGLRGIDGEILKAAQIDGASAYRDLSAHRHPDHAAGVLLRARSCSRIWRSSPTTSCCRSPARTPAARRNCPRPSCIPTPSPATRWRSARPAPSSC